MLKTIDSIAINSIFMLLVFIWTFFIVKNIWWAIAISLIAYVLIWSILKIMKMKKKGLYSGQNFAKHLAIMGYPYSVKLIYDNLSSENKRIVDDKYIIVENKSKELIYPLFKFGNMNYENVAQVYRIAEENQCKKVYMLSNGIDKNALLLANGLNIKFEYVNVETIYNNLKSKNALPELVEFNDKPINKMSLKLFFQSIISPNNTKYYALIGVLFSFMSFITPAQAYYVSLATIAFILAIITILPVSKSLNKDKSMFTEKAGGDKKPSQDFTKKFMSAGGSRSKSKNNENTQYNGENNANSNQNIFEENNDDGKSIKDVNDSIEKNNNEEYQPENDDSTDKNDNANEETEIDDSNEKYAEESSSSENNQQKRENKNESPDKDGQRLLNGNSKNNDAKKRFENTQKNSTPEKNYNSVNQNVNNKNKNKANNNNKKNQNVKNNSNNNA